jgi:Methyltransferase domain
VPVSREARQQAQKIDDRSGGEAPVAAYDHIGLGYNTVRRPDPRLAQRIWAALGEARTVVNVGAGTGSYEPTDRQVIAVEPSQVMIAQRSADAAPVLAAGAESLPLATNTVDAGLAILTVHHWGDVEAGLVELARVARQRIVIVTMDVPVLKRMWLISDYLGDALDDHLREFPTVERIRAALPRSRAVPLEVPRDCTDGFMAAFWARPEAYLDPAIRSASSPWHAMRASAVEAALARLEEDLRTGAWDRRYGTLRTRPAHDVGMRLVIAELS